MTELSPCLADDLLPVRWILALRGEWLSHLGTFRPQIRNPFANEILLRALSREQAREVIVEPALRRGVTYEPLLVERLLEDLGRDEISPPQLQLVCSALFEARDGQGQITAALYDQAGSAGGILRGHLDRVLSRDILPGQRQAARRLLEALVTAEKRRALRPRDDLGKEMARQGVDEATLDAVLAQLVDGRLLRVEERGEGAVLAYELAHDYLLEEIQLHPAAQAHMAAQELLAQKLPYYARDRLLLSADELAIINPQRQWLALSDEAGRLLRESQLAVTRRKRLTIGAIVAAAVFILAAILAAVLMQSSAVQQQANLQGRGRVGV